jgi:hypothetical protein
MAAKKTTAAAAQVTVKITVNANADKVYVVGNTENLGAWDAKNAVALKAVDGKFEVSKKFDANAVVEFKVLAAKDWEAVEKGIWNEDLENHTSTAIKGLVVEIGVDHFAK